MYSLVSLIDEATNKLSTEDFEFLGDKYVNFTLAESKNVTFKNLNAHLFVYNTTSSEGLNIKNLSLFLETNNKIYKFSYATEAGKFVYYEPIVFDMLNSTRFFVSVTPKLEEFSDFEDANKLFKFSYPSNWNLITMQPNKDEGVIVENLIRAPREGHFDPFLEVMRILVQNFSHIDPSSVDAYKLLAYTRYWITQFPIQNISALTGELGHYPAYVLNYTLNDQKIGFPLKSITSFIVKNDKSYLVQFTAQKEKFDSYLPTFQKISRSFEIK